MLSVPLCLFVVIGSTFRIKTFSHVLPFACQVPSICIVVIFQGDAVLDVVVVHVSAAMSLHIGNGLGDEKGLKEKVSRKKEEFEEEVMKRV